MSCPVSWLDLELYALGELQGEQLARVEAQLHDCAECKEDLATIRGDARPMAALPPSTGRGWRFWAPVGGMLAAAAALLVVGLGSPEDLTKGGDVALSLALQRGGSIVEHPKRYQGGDRVQARLTCDAPGQVQWHWVVFEGGGAGVRVDRGLTTCRNEVVVPGAIELTGTDIFEICVALEPPPEPWNDPSALGAASDCVTLTPEQL